LPHKPPPNPVSISLPQSAETPPADWVALAEVGAPIGLKGAVRLRTLDSVAAGLAESSVLFNVRSCWLQTPMGQWIHDSILECSPQTRGLKLQLSSINSRELAELIRGAQVGLARQDFPKLEAHENYWSDLIGCQVVNRQGLSMGHVLSMQSNGEHDWLVVSAGWIPFVAQYIDRVDTDLKIIFVDWDPDWFS
jgi:16S rRNA processing protein RimM